jgi:hypothetical protein
METCTYWFDLNMHASLAHPGYIRDAWQANEVFLACFFFNESCLLFREVDVEMSAVESVIYA